MTADCFLYYGFKLLTPQTAHTLYNSVTSIRYGWLVDFCKLQARCISSFQNLADNGGGIGIRSEESENFYKKE